MKTTITTLCFLLTLSCWCQSTYETPSKDNIPKELKQYRKAIEVMNFPKENHPVKIKNTYYWKHTTTIISTESDITISEYGAYLFYNNTWNHRKSYPLKELDKTFGTKNQIMLIGQPYVWPNNWRVGESLFGGWALWYFIGKTENGETVCGYGNIETTDKPLN